MMEATGKMKRIKRAYSTNDIVKVVVSVNRDYWHQCSEFAKQFQRPTEYETCKAVNDFVVENIQYKEDGSTHQYVKTPARLLKDKEGDCKSMSIFVASCLTCLQIPCSLRFVSFGSTDVKHVYVVTQSGLNVDPVEMIQKRRKFGEITLFTHHIDMKANYGLAILSGVGSAEPYQAFLNGTDFLRNTRATNYIYSCIDLQMAILRADTNNIEAMNNLCRFITTLVLYNESTGYNSLHLISANIIQLLDDRGYFNYHLLAMKYVSRT